MMDAPTLVPSNAAPLSWHRADTDLRRVVLLAQARDCTRTGKGGKQGNRLHTYVESKATDWTGSHLCMVCTLSADVGDHELLQRVLI